MLKYRYDKYDNSVNKKTDTSLSLLTAIFLLLLLFFTFFGFSFAQKSSGQKITPPVVDQQLEKFIQNKKPIVTEEISKSKKEVIRSLIADINSMCGRYNINPRLILSAKCTTRDSNGNIVTVSLDCHGGSSCIFTKITNKRITITQTPVSAKMQATPNVPPESAVSTERWLKVFAGLVYVSLTIYLFILASNNLLKREVLSLAIDLSLWAALTTAMYFILNGGI